MPDANNQQQGGSQQETTTTATTTTTETQTLTIPDKFKTAEGTLNSEAVLKAYSELESKFTELSQQGAKNQSTATPSSPATATESKAAFVVDENAIGLELQANNGVLTDATRASLKQAGLTDTLIDTVTTSIKITQKQAIDEILNYAGLTPDSHKVVMEWAKSNVDAQTLLGLNAALSAGKDVGKLAMKSIATLYRDTNGFDPEVQVVASAAGGGSGGFASMEELIAAKRDPRWLANNKAYVAEVNAKLKASTFFRN